MTGVQHEARVSALFVYPLKGAAGLALEAAELDALGFRHDRRWMVVDAGSEFVSQRTHPRLALIRPELEAGTLRLRAPGLEPLVLPAPGADGGAEAGTVTVRVWRDTVQATAAGDAADRWISGYLGERARVVHFGAGAVRPVDPAYAPRATDRVAFTDGYPCLLISAAALDELNRRLERPVPMERFRPNLVVGGSAAHAEDGWRRIRAGEVVFDVVKPCARCVVTTVDQRTAVAGPEPLRTLATYRKVGNKVMFGQNLVHQAPGRVSVGDRIEMLE
jgi:uncharacterized protein YcbX